MNEEQEMCNIWDAADHLRIPEGRVKKMKIRYRAGNGTLIKESVYFDARDAIRIFGIENVTHNKQTKMTRGYVRAFVPSREGVRTLSTKGKCLTVLR